MEGPTTAVLRAGANDLRPDIYRTANILVKQHGENAPIQAAMRADAMPERGDLEGCAVWKRARS